MRFLFLALAILLMIGWLCAFVFLHVASALIHLLLFFAVVAFIIHLVTAPKRA
jgi:hypothetical protein